MPQIQQLKRSHAQCACSVPKRCSSRTENASSEAQCPGSSSRELGHGECACQQIKSHVANANFTSPDSLSHVLIQGVMYRAQFSWVPPMQLAGCTGSTTWHPLCLVAADTPHQCPSGCKLQRSLATPPIKIWAARCRAPRACPTPSRASSFTHSAAVSQEAARRRARPFPDEHTMHEGSQTAPALVATRLPAGRQQLPPRARLHRLLPYAGSIPLGPGDAGPLGRRGAAPAPPARRPAAPEALRRRVALDDAVEVHGFLRCSRGA